MLSMRAHVQYTNKPCDVLHTYSIIRKYVRETQQSCDNIVKSFEALHIKEGSAVIYLMLFYHALMFRVCRRAFPSQYFTILYSCDCVSVCIHLYRYDLVFVD